MYRKSILKPVKVKVWDEYIGEDIGEDVVNNLFPICRLCNLSWDR